MTDYFLLQFTLTVQSITQHMCIIYSLHCSLYDLYLLYYYFKKRLSVCVIFTLRVVVHNDDQVVYPLVCSTRHVPRGVKRFAASIGSTMFLQGEETEARSQGYIHKIRIIVLFNVETVLIPSFSDEL